MAIGLLVAHSSEAGELISLGLELAARLDKPLAILCPMPTNREHEADGDSFAVGTEYLQSVRSQLASLANVDCHYGDKSSHDIPVGVIEIPSRIDDIRQWLSQSHSTDELGRFSIDILLVPRLAREDEAGLRAAKHALFAAAQGETVYVRIADKLEPCSTDLQRIGYAGAGSRERSVARKFARRLMPTQLIELTAEDVVTEAAEGLDGVVLGVFGSSTEDQINKSKFWKTVRSDSAIPVAMVVNRADSLFDRFLLWSDNLFRTVFAAEQMTRDDRERLARELREGTRPSAEFILFMMLATSLACIGLLQNSPAVIIGAMLVAPLMTPLLGAGLSMVQGNLPLLRAAVHAIAVGVTLSFLLGATVGVVVNLNDKLFLGGEFQLTGEMIARSHPNLLDPIVGLVAGLAAGFSIGRDKKVGALAGVAIAASLVPPIATSGLEASIAMMIAFDQGLHVFPELFLNDPGDYLVRAKLLNDEVDVANVRLIIAPLLLFVMNACAVIVGAFTGLRFVGMHRTTYPKRSHRWVVKVILLLILVIVFTTILTIW
jgi:uncharacterized hydrophobic protein (TIGR00271 family)